MLGKRHAQGREHAIGHPALTDPATGLANRLHFDLVYSYLFAAGDRGLVFTVMLLSVGGQDALPEDRLRAIGQRVQKTTRESDLVSHVGRGRFAILLIGTNLSGARIAADRIELAIAEVARGEKVSLGLAQYENRMQEPSELLEAADRALLEAEAAGGGIELA